MSNTSQQRLKPAEAAPDKAALSKLVYHSRASESFSSRELNALMDVAVSRNAKEKITGTLVYDQGRFIQWLEGPSESLGRVVHSIKEDSRHCEFEILQAGRVKSRAFRDWSMRLGVRKAEAGDVPADTLRASDRPMEALLSYPDAAPSLLRVLFGDAADNTDRAPKNAYGSTRASIENVISEIGFKPIHEDPEGYGGWGDMGLEKLPHLRASSAELARIFTDARDEIDQQRVEAICRAAACGLDDFVRLFGMTANALGDLWHDNKCTEADIAVALSELQIVYSRMRRHGVIQPDRDVSDLRTIVAQLPGDMHIVGTILKADVLRSRGWDAAVRFPESDRALAEDLRDEHVDSVVISSSRVLSDPDILPRMTRLIEDLRRASQNRDLMVLVAGRVFNENPEAWQAVGADASANSPLMLPALMRRLLLE